MPPPSGGPAVILVSTSLSCGYVLFLLLIFLGKQITKGKKKKKKKAFLLM
jgi:hypothetical protein